MRILTHPETFNSRLPTLFYSLNKLFRGIWGIKISPKSGKLCRAPYNRKVEKSICAVRLFVTVLLNCSVAVPNA